MYATAPGPITSQLPDPGVVGTSEYRAIHELLCDVEESARHEERTDDEARSLLDSSLTEVTEAVALIRARLGIGT